MAKYSLRLAASPEPVRAAICDLASATTLDFFNAVTAPEQIVDRIKDDPTVRAERRGYGIRLGLARRILERRQELGRFTSLRQIDEIRGVGVDTLHDIVHSFRDSPGQIDVDRLFRESLDLCSHRVDAWVTSFATKRLAGMRENEATRQGIHLGAYGFLENLKPRGGASASEGYLHAPSAGQAAAAAVLYNAFLTHDPEKTREPGEQRTENPFRVNLTSGRVQSALRVLEGVRHGQPAGALLGYQFERALRDAALPLAQYIDDFREGFPIVAHKLTPAPGEAAEVVAARSVVDGAALARDYREIRDLATGDVDPALSKLGRLLQDIGDADHVAGLRRILDGLENALDAIGDLMITESVYQAVQGNYERAGAALEAASGNQSVPELESIVTPVAGRTFTHRVCLLFNRSLGFAGAAAKAEDPRGAAEPRIAAWFGELLGPLEEIGVGFTFAGHSERLDLNLADQEALAALPGIDGALAQAIVAEREGARGPFLRIDDLSRVDGLSQAEIGELRPRVTAGLDALGLHELGFSATDLLYAAQSTPEGGATDLETLVARLVRLEYALPATQRVDVHADRRGAFARSLADAAELARQALTLLAAGRPMTPDTMCHPGDVTAEGYADQDVATFAARLQEGQQRVSNTRPGEPPGLLQEFGELPNRASDVVALLLKAARFGVPGAVPAGLDDPHLAERFENARDELARRHAASEQLAGEALAAQKPSARLRALLEAMKALFGPSFVVLPSVVPRRAGELASALAQDVLNGHGEARLRLWLEQVAEVRAPLAVLEDTLIFAEAWTQATRLAGSPSLALEVAQLPFTDGRRWVALSDAEKGAEQPRAEWARSPLSLVVASNGALPAFEDDAGENGRVVTAGLLLDEWSELVPDSHVSTSVAFQYDAPNAQAPQALLLAVPAEMKAVPELWTPEALAGIVGDTLDLAKVRAVDIDALPAEALAPLAAAPEPVGGILPGVYLPADPARPGWARDIAMSTIDQWVDALASQPAPCADIWGFVAGRGLGQKFEALGMQLVSLSGGPPLVVHAGNLLVFPPTGIRLSWAPSARGELTIRIRQISGLVLDPVPSIVAYNASGAAVQSGFSGPGNSRDFRIDLDRAVRVELSGGYNSNNKSHIYHLISLCVRDLAPATEIVEGAVFGAFTVRGIVPQGAPAGDYTFRQDDPLVGLVRLLRNGTEVRQLAYDWHTTISFDSTYTFSFPGYLDLEIGKTGTGTQNLYGLKYSLFDGQQVLKMGNA